MEHKLRKPIAALLLLAIASSLLSVFLSNLFFALAVLLWLLDCGRLRRFYLRVPAFVPVLLVFVAAVGVSIVFSTDVGASALYLKKVLKLFYPLLIFTYFTRADVDRTFKLIFLLLGATAAFGILQYYWLMEVDLMNRIDGFMSHWMTFSGQLMLGAVALTAYIAFGRRSPAPPLSRFPTLPIALWPALLGLLVFALALTMTRNAWLGTAIGLFVVLSLRSVRWSVALIAGAALAFFLLPSHFEDRLYSSFDPSDVTTRIRLELLKTGKNMIIDQPWTGVGPRMVPRVYASYRESDEFPESIYQHLHNDAVQIAAEMGLIALGAWIGLWLWLGRDLFRFRRTSSAGFPEKYVYVCGLGAIAAFLFSGLFEYNFGDSEVLVLLLFLITAPYVVSRDSRDETLST